MSLCSAFGKVKNQIWAIMIANVGCISIGGAVGWFSTALPVFVSAKTAIGAISSYDIGWIMAHHETGSICGILLFGLIANRIGSRNSMMWGMIPIIISWPVIIFATSVWHLGLSKFLVGLTNGCHSLCTILYVADISDVNIRGTIGGSVVISIFLGVALGYIFGTYLTFVQSAIYLSALSVLSLIGFIFIPSTPQHILRSKKCKKNGEKSLRFYRNCPIGSRDERDLELTEEFKELLVISRQKNEKQKVLSSAFYNRTAIKAIFVCTTLVLVSKFTGSIPLLHYAVTIFQESGSTIDPNVSSIVMGCMQVLGLLCATVLVDWTGRKSLLLVSTMCSAICLLVTSFFSYYTWLGNDLAAYNTIPVIFLSLFKFVTNIGLGPIPNILIPELLPRNIRSAGTSICMCVAHIGSFAILKLFPLLLEWLKLHGCLWFFAGISIFGFVFTFFCIAETKGKNLHLLENKS